MTAFTAQRPRPREPAARPVPGPSGAVAISPVLLGMASSTLLAITGSRLADRRFAWWFRLTVDPAWLERTVFYLAMVGLVLAWLALARRATIERCRPSSMAAVAFGWCLPLLVGPPLFSHDIYSYLAQGTIAHIGRSPYHYAPVVLGHLGHHHVLAGVDPFWRRATAPYGPLFLGVISLIVGLTGSHVFAGVILIRLFNLLGLALLAHFLPRLARLTGADPTRAVWLAAASPLMLLQLVAPGHNDLLMAGVMAAGVTVALEHRPLLGIAICMLAATIKLPAVAAAVFIAVAWMRSAPSWRSRAGRAAKAAIAAIVTLTVITLVTGFGLGWLSTSLFSTPGRVRLAITPATDISFTIAKLLSGVSFAGAESVLRVILALAAVAVGLWSLARTRWQTLVQCLGVVLIAAAIGGPALWPWYLAWGLALLAAWRAAQYSRIVIGTVVAASFLVKPDGILLLSRGSSPEVAALWLLAAVAAIVTWVHRSRAGARA